MEHIKNFANLAENFSAEFPDLAKLSHLYILSSLFDGGGVYNFLSAFPSTFAWHLLNSQNIFSSEKQVKELAKYLIHTILTNIKSNPPEYKSLNTLIKELSIHEPQAVKVESRPTTPEQPNSIEEFLTQPRVPDYYEVEGNWYSIDWYSLSDSATSKFTEFEINKALVNPQYLYPSESVESLLAEVADPAPKQVIYNPTCGIGSLFVELEKHYPNHNFEYYGCVDNRFSELLCEANLYANGIKAEIKLANILEVGKAREYLLFETKKAQRLVKRLEKESDKWWSLFDKQAGDSVKADIAIAISTFGNKLFKGDLDKNIFPDTYDSTRIEYPQIEEMISSLKKTGKAIIVVPDNFLFSTKGKSLRKKYLSLDLIERVVSLPHNAFKPHNSIRTSIIVFNKNKANKNTIFFDGKDARFEESEVTVDSIVSDHNSDLRVSRYALKEKKEVESILSKYPPDEVKRIKDLIDSSISGYNYSPDNRIVEDSSENLPYVRVKDLSNSNKDFTLDVSKVERVISREKARKKTVIDFSAVLVSKIAPKLKPTLFDFAGQPIVIGSDVIALQVKEDVNVEYFLTQLYSRLVQIQVEMMSSGTIINRISAQDFLNIQIILPPLDEQQREVSEVRPLIVEKLSAEERIIEVEFDIVASINHSLKNKLAVINNDYDTLVRFLRRKERKKETIIFSDPISANAVGDDIDTIEVITSRLKTNLSDASKVFNNALKIQKQNLKKDVVELVKFFKEEVKPLYAGKNFSIEVNVKSGLKLNVWLDKDAFKDVIENLIENAKSHGFVDDEKNYRIVFELSKLEDPDDVDRKTSTQYAKIVYKNDGKPFPKNFSFEDYKQFSNKAGRTQGTGIGGYVINKMIDLHDGKLNFIAPSDDFTVEFEIILPLED